MRCCIIPPTAPATPRTSNATCPGFRLSGVGRASSRAAATHERPGSRGRYAPTFYPLSAIATMQGDKTPAHDPKASAKLFHAFADAGKKLAALHVNYESAKEYKLQRIENKAVKLDWRVEAMKLIGRRRGDESPTSKTKNPSLLTSAATVDLYYNDFLTLSGIPPEVFDYKLGNRSALEWVIDQYRVTRDAQGNISSDPNRMDDEQYIVRLIGQVITVSLETQKIIAGLPDLAAYDTKTHF